MFAFSWLRPLQRRWFPRRAIRRAAVRRWVRRVRGLGPPIALVELATEMGSSLAWLVSWSADGERTNAAQMKSGTSG